MTEAEWLASEDPDQMLSHARDWLTERRLRLFASACCRRLALHLKDQRSLRLVDTSERFADGLATRDELSRAFEGATEAYEAIRWQSGDAVTQGAAAAVLGLGEDGDLIQVFEGTRDVGAARGAARAREHRPETPGWPRRDDQYEEQEGAERGEHEEAAAQADLVRDFICNPFRPVAFDPTWRTDTVVALARGMYESRDFGAMPILADALQDAGCDSDDILDHCRGSGPHVRGCWVVDLVLGKE
jgi:hypothetical protein